MPFVYYVNPALVNYSFVPAFSVLCRASEAVKKKGRIYFSAGSELELFGHSCS
jgi:hypothetical protein